MSKRTAAKHKIDRRMGENLWGRPKSPVNRREYGPGEHGQRRKAKLSDFGIQLRAKQKLKGYYGDLTEKQFRRIFAEAERIRGDTGENLVGLLERRLDALIYRAKFVPTIFSARQFVNHGHILVNGKGVNIPSYRVNEGDVIELIEKLVSRLALQIDTQTEQKELTSQKISKSIDVFLESNNEFKITDYKSFIDICSGLTIPKDNAINLIKNDLCEVKNETVTLSTLGTELQEKMNIFTKVHNQLKVEGIEANSLIDSALEKLGDL